MKMNCLSRLLSSSKNKNSSEKIVNSATKSKNTSTLERAQNIYIYYNSLVSPKKSQNSTNILFTNNNSYNNKSMIMSGSSEYGSFQPSPTPSIHSPGMETLSSPALTSTPAAADSVKLLDGYANLRNLDICFLPEVVLDKLFSKLTDEDIRRFYQVSRSWKNAVVCRKSVNRRREEYVQKIRQNKENIIKGKQDSVQKDVVNRAIRDISNSSSGKPGSRQVLNDCSNQLTSSFASNTSNGNNRNEFSPAISSTPTSRFSSHSYEKWQQAERNLKEGQRLFRCKKCYGPVASPVASKKEEISNAKCRLTARMSSIEDLATKRRESKKQRTLVKSCPSNHEDIISVCEMAQRLSISHSQSAPEVSSSGRSPLLRETRKLRAKSAPAMLSKSNTGIDLPISMINDSGSVNCNVSNINFDFSSSTQSIFFKSPSPVTTTNLNNNCLTISPKFTSNSNITSNSIGSALSQNLSDSGFSMSYINSDDDFNESHLHASTILTPEPVRKGIEESPLALSLSEGRKFGSSGFLFRQALCNNMRNNVNLNKSLHVQDNDNGCHNNMHDNPNRNCTNEFRVPADSNEYHNVNQSLDPMLDSHSQQYSESTKTSSYSVLRDASTTRSSLALSPHNQSNKERSIRSESLNNISMFAIPTLGISQPSRLELSGSMMNSSLNQNDSIALECPDCSYRFCSVCEENEHIGKPCRVIDSDSFRQDAYVEPIAISPFNKSGLNPNSNSNSSMCSKGKGKGSAKEESKKRLRRIAKK